MNARARIAFTCGMLLAAGCLSSAADQVYRWVDKDGHVHYSQTPPAGTDVQAQSVNVNSPPPDPTGLQNAQNLDKQVADQNKKSQDAAQKAQQDAADKASKKAHCEDLRSRLNVLQSSGRTAQVDAQGNYTYMSDEERASQLKGLQDQIAKDCTGV